MMRRLLAGDDSALSAVYDRYSPMVHGIARRLLGAGSAQDICQEVFVALWRQPERFDPARGSLVALLATMTHRRCIDELRRTGRRVANEERAALGAERPAPIGPEGAGLARLTAATVRGALDQLPAPQREAVELAYFQGLSYRQVAKVVGVGEGTAKSRLRLAHRRLAVLLHELDPGVTL